MNDAFTLTRPTTALQRTTILVVDDDRNTRELFRKSLRDLGYEVLAAGDGTTALQVSRMHRGAIHLLLADAVMPGMSGLKLANQMLASRSSLRVLYVSGFVKDIVVQGSLRPEDGFLAKPFSTEVLAKKIQELLSA